MKTTDAAQILGLSGTITPEDVKSAFRRAAKTYHPDVNPAGAEMMKIVNEAYETLKDHAGDIGETAGSSETASYPEALNEALNAIIGLGGLEIEICGAWVWVAGDTYSHRATLKEAGFRFASKKKRWYFRPVDWASTSRGSYSMDDIRNTYGSTRPQGGRGMIDQEQAS